jgi:hypothetical protein
MSDEKDNVVPFRLPDDGKFIVKIIDGVPTRFVNFDALSPEERAKYMEPPREPSGGVKP